MAHEVRVRIDTAVVSHKDFVVLVEKDGHKLGKLLISKGNIEWWPKGHSVNKKRLKWEKFGEFMAEYGTNVKAK